MIASEFQFLAQVFTERLLNTAAEGIVLVGLVWLLLVLIRGQNSGTRFAIWFSALAAIVALPFFGGSGFGAPSSLDLPAATLHRGISLPRSWAIYLFAAWAVGAGLLLVRLGVGLWRVRTFRRNCSDVDLAGIDPALAGMLRDFSSRRGVKVCVSSETAAPAAVGFFRPAIVFPAWLFPQLSAEEIHVILLHELAHLRRWDDWTNLAQKVVKAVFFFHPAVWWIESRLTLEREMACDDLVLAQTTSPRAYASSLISFAEKLHSVRGLALAQALVSRMHQMSQRVRHILDAKRPSRTGLWKPVLALSAGMLGLVFVATPYAPHFVAFQNQPSAPIPMTLQSTNTGAQPTAADLVLTHLAATGVTQESKLEPQPRLIPASFHPAMAPVRRQLRATSPRRTMAPPARTPQVEAAQVSAEQERLPVRATLMILQTTQYDASGSRVWTLCVWQVGGENRAVEQQVERQFEQAIVLSLI
jgi:beta-lactamase regulating signal transducer with metallopeptidase domain